MSKMEERRCRVCTTGVIEPHGYEADGRPRYICHNCTNTHLLRRLECLVRGHTPALLDPSRTCLICGKRNA
jgi:transposase-like protein